MFEQPQTDNHCLLYLVRHGDSRQDQVKRYIGRTDLPLNAVGRSQARALQKNLAEVSFKRIYSSDLRRCMETARIIAAPQGKSIRSLPAMREIDLGEWDGKSMASIRRRFPEEFQRRGLDLTGFQPPGGESFRDLQNRVVPAFQEIIGQSEGTLLLVAHAGVNRAILCHVLGQPLEDLFKIPQAFGCLNIIERRGGQLAVKALNQTGDCPEPVIAPVSSSGFGASRQPGEQVEG
jgi:alpha-ribazole phosphatase